MSSIVIWRPERFTAKLIAAATPARVKWAALARSRCSSKRVAESVAVVGDRVAARHPLAPIVEFGAKPHEIQPQKKSALKLADGSFVGGAVAHPGSEAKPFLRPTLPAWPTLYRREAAGAIRSV